jgi:hypothetical protein
VTLVRSDRRHEFELAPDDLWAAIEDVDSYRSWWPWLRRLEADGGVEAGAEWRCTVQPPLPYALRFRLRIVSVDVGSAVAAELDGDVQGTASFELRPAGAGTEVHLLSALEPGNRWLRAVTRWAAPVAKYGHDWVLDTAVRQFASARRA